MRKYIYSEEWKRMMEKAIEEENIHDIKFLWSKIDMIMEKGYFTLPF